MNSEKVENYKIKAFELLEDYKKSKGKDLKEILYSETIINNGK